MTTTTKLIIRSEVDGEEIRMHFRVPKELADSYVRIRETNPELEER